MKAERKKRMIVIPKGPAKDNGNGNGENKTVKEIARVDLPQALKLFFEKGLNFSQIAQMQHVSRQAVAVKLKKFRDLLLTDEELTQFQENKNKLTESVQLTLLSSLGDPTSIKKATLNQRAFAYASVSKELHLQLGESSENIMNVSFFSSIQDYISSIVFL